jgi:spore coat polysaccharide biosynthesis protein SpsF
MKRKLAAVLACRNGGSRLYAKPLQNLDEANKVTIIQYIIDNLKKNKTINTIGLAISKNEENLIYKKIARSNRLKFILGSDDDVLKRLINCAKKLNATDIFRITTESPFTYLDELPKIWNNHVKNNYDATFSDNIVDGCGFEIIKLKALQTSHIKGKKKHKSELCSLYIRENFKKFKINRVFPDKKYFRKDLRLTVDNPEDLIVCKKIYKNIKNEFKLNKAIQFLDKNPQLKELIVQYCDKGYSNMYKWGTK